jgi:hypothetical protein
LWVTTTTAVAGPLGAGAVGVAQVVAVDLDVRRRPKRSTGLGPVRPDVGELGVGERRPGTERRVVGCPGKSMLRTARAASKPAAWVNW